MKVTSYGKLSKPSPSFFLSFFLLCCSAKKTITVTTERDHNLFIFPTVMIETFNSAEAVRSRHMARFHLDNAASL